ncbi:uncharacterized protein LOC130452659 [Diorhabda sublineata]|uniref:uncharacterized protein LOC130452659 n=1 Tax=Diorhabda sublineata TaxID=1163346 RepID=UPI0024E060A5|nr:uncharacterized protein LOC130452659 [Diorhabda sublineata]
MKMSRFRFLSILMFATVTLALNQRKLKPKDPIVNNHLQTADDDSGDSEYMKIEATGDKINKKTKNKTADDDKPKTLSQQIADGKYALIQKEIFSKPPKKLGILSYDINHEVPNDDIKNLGGLDKNDIWLAENHLLVLRGGVFPPYDDRKDTGESPWAPLDNYKAPLHQVKIPKNPKVPPPFPVQLFENGPLQILGTNSSRTINGTYENALNAIPPPEGYPSPRSFYEPHNTNKANSTPWSATLPISSNPSQGEYPGGLPLPPFNLNGTLPPSLNYLPPGSVILPPPGNQTDYIDYDDPSIYYPPPYSFYYPKDNTSNVPPGPLVPGIILPPPPNFFAPLEDTPSTSSPTRKPQRYRKPTTTQVTITISKSTTKKTTSSPKTVKIYPIKNHQYLSEVRKMTTARPPIKSVTIVPEVYAAPQKSRHQITQGKKNGVTILRPINPPPHRLFTYENEIPNNKPFKNYGPPETEKISVTTTTPSRYQSKESKDEENFSRSRKYKTTARPRQYYFYNENEDENSRKINTFKENNEPYYVRPKPLASRQRRPQYVYVTAKPYNTQKPRFRFIQQPVNRDTFNVHISKLKNQIQNYYTTPSTTSTFRSEPKPVYQFSFQAANYPSAQIHKENQFQRIPAEYTVEIQQAIEIITPKYQENVLYQHTTQRPYYPSTTRKQEVTRYVNDMATSKPVSEYSFEVTPNPVYQNYYTKPEVNYFDDRTKTYFTMFGRKLPTSTTPIPRVEPNPNYQQKPVSLEGDTLVNYIHPRPTINPDAEILPIDNTPRYPSMERYSSRNPQKGNSQIIKAIEVPSSEPRDGSFISYELPGDDGAHFYFLTPQLAQRKDQGAGFYFSKARRRRNDKTLDVQR